MKNYKKQIAQLLDEYEITYFHNYKVDDYSIDMYVPILNIGITFYKSKATPHNCQKGKNVI